MAAKRFLRQDNLPSFAITIDLRNGKYPDMVYGNTALREIPRSLRGSKKY